MIIIRDDDVVLPSGGHSDPVGAFKRVHNWITECPHRFLHLPTLLITEIQDFPDAISFIQAETEAGRMSPQIHGLEHIDYGPLSPTEVDDHLGKCKDWFKDHGLPAPALWATPWGASQPHLHEAAKRAGLLLQDTTCVIPIENAHSWVRRKGILSDFEDKTIFMHWWSRGLRLKRIIETGKHGTWHKARQANPDIF